MKVFGARVAPVWLAGVLVSVVALVLSGCGGEPMSVESPTPGAASCHDGGVCKVGDMGPGGGTVFYVADSSQSWGRYLEAAPEGWSGGADPVAPWGCAGTDVPGANGTAIGGGAANTGAIIAACGTDGIAAKVARAYAGGGKTDWYLPTKAELNEVHGQRNRIAGLATEVRLVWSSSQHDQSGAAYQEFSTGDQGVASKSDAHLVHPVRAFSSLTPPVAPAAPTSSGVGDGSVTLNWVAPADNGSAITGYEVQVGTSAGGVFSDAQGCAGLGAVLTCTATGLRNNTFYYFKVRAKNAFGAGGFSEAGGPYVPLDETCVNGGACKVGDKGPGGGAVFYAADSPQPWGQYLEAAPANWQGEDPTAIWGCPGIDVPGALGTGIGDGGGNTDAIIGVCGTDRIAARWARYYNGGANGQAKTDWYLPSKDELVQLMQHQDVVGGIEHAYYWTSTEANSWNAWVVGHTGEAAEGWRGIDITSEVRVRPVRTFSKGNVPQVPAAPSSRGRDDGSVSLEWVAPEDGGSTIVGYDVQFSTAPDGQYASVAGCPGIGPGLTCTATGLKNGTNYYFRIRALNYIGVGGFSAPGGPFTPAVLCANGGACAIGDTGPGGGTVFYVADGKQSWGQYLEAAPKGWSGGGIDVVAPWGCAGTAISDAGGTGVGSGAANTAAISKGCADSGTAAKDAGGYRGGGKDDWYLPTKDELNELFKHRNQVAGLGVGDYWSSSQNDKYTSDFQNLERGDQYVSDKASGKSVRAVRAFSPMVPTP